MGIHAQNIRKRFKDFVALDNVSLEVKSGELVALLGPSGSGKTTLLRIIAGLDSADSGIVHLDGEQTDTKGVQERKVGFVFQHYALFKHMTVFENVAFGLRVRPKEHRPSDYHIKRKVMELLQLVHLDTFHDRYPSQLSGGQRQRVALARALAVEPKVLLLDEPFGALDAKVRKELRRWMRRLHDEIHITSIFVTHDQEEAMEVSDRVVVMSNGRIEQMGTPEEVWQQPANAFVYDFLGNYNEFDGWKDSDGNIHLAETDIVEIPSITASVRKSAHWLNRYPEISTIVNKVMPGLIPETPLPSLPLKQRSVRKPSGEKAAKLYARPHEMWVTKTPDEKEYIQARVIHINPAGSLVKLELERSGGQILQVEIPKSILDQYSIIKGDVLFVRPKQTKVFE
ncbi:MAG: sulfate transporter ATP-binding protein [Rickettsiales bacterium]|jgi:sulfate transport system ATP-binding protein|nr:sulfate transporter ATP-binding protein [Rickettsiales bacterium]